MMKTGYVIIQWTTGRGTGEDGAACASGRLVLGFDSTYLLKMKSALCIHGQEGICGGAFSLADVDSPNPGSFMPWSESAVSPACNVLQANRMFLGCSWTRVLAMIGKTMRNTAKPSMLVETIGIHWKPMKAIESRKS